MSIELFTGLPGAGKSLSLVARLVELHRNNPGRPIYAYGIDGLKEGLGEPCDPYEWQSLPDGSIVVVDEAQKVWPSARAGEVPDKIRAFSEHRHRGFDFLIATQDPKYLHSYLRKLCQPHTHIVRRWGGKTVDRYVFQEGQEDVKSQAVRRGGQRTRWRYPKECFDLYKSSTMHTVKRKLPWQWYLMVLAFLAAPVVIWLAYHKVTHLGNASRSIITGSSESSSPVGVSRKADKWTTVEGYVKDHLPRVAGQPWSAPVFDSVDSVKAQPDLYCIEYHRTINGRDQELCGCYTEQVTPYELHSLEECRRYARHGVYNPRRAPLGGPDQYVRQDDANGRSTNASPGTRAPASGPGESESWPSAVSPLHTMRYIPPEQSKVMSQAGSWGSGG